MYAIIQDGGHQYRVEKGQRIQVELRPTEKDAVVTFDQVCLVAGSGDPQVGRPFVDGAKVEGKVIQPELKAAKIVGHTFKRRKGTHRRYGHRQRYVEIEITEISA
ncbi:MAG: 50S ribosomal protein L21 [Planctomycetes bacterium]|jgi:large subunit ribosomal protein L21|nr:50S ribosomal protein L21 [Planctomycetota bacterium]